MGQWQQAPVEREDLSEENHEEKELRAQSPWQIGVHDQQPPSQRLTKQRKSNSRYVSATLATFEKPLTYEDASQNIQWRKAMEEQEDALSRHRSWYSIPEG